MATPHLNGWRWCFQILNLEGHLNCITGLRVTAILLNGWIMPIGGGSVINMAYPVCFIYIEKGRGEGGDWSRAGVGGDWNRAGEGTYRTPPSPQEAEGCHTGRGPQAAHLVGRCQDSGVEKEIKELIFLTLTLGWCAMYDPL